MLGRDADQLSYPERTPCNSLSGLRVIEYALGFLCSRTVSHAEVEFGDVAAFETFLLLFKRQGIMGPWSIIPGSLHSGASLSSLVLEEPSRSWLSGSGCVFSEALSP